MNELQKQASALLKNIKRANAEDGIYLEDAPTKEDIYKEREEEVPYPDPTTNPLAMTSIMGLGALGVLPLYLARKYRIAALPPKMPKKDYARIKKLLIERAAARRTSNAGALPELKERP